MQQEKRYIEGPMTTEEIAKLGYQVEFVPYKNPNYRWWKFWEPKHLGGRYAIVIS